MTLYTGVLTGIYIIAQGIAGIMGLTIFIVVLKGSGFNMASIKGRTTTTGVGYGFILAVVLALLSVGPLYGFESALEIPDNFPTEFFLDAYWGIYIFMIMLFFIVTVYKTRIFSSLYFLIPIICIITASWISKTTGLMITVIMDSKIGFFTKSIYQILGIAYIMIYLFAPIFIMSKAIGKRKTAD